MSDFSKPKPIDRAEIAFPAAVVGKFLPPWEEIPAEFKDMNSRDKWRMLFSDWFYSGISITEVKPKAGVDPNLAVANLQAVTGSFEPKHEHKVAGFRYLCSLWFDDVIYTREAQR